MTGRLYPHKLRGRIAGRQGRFLVVACDGEDVPGHLRRHFLSWAQIPLELRGEGKLVEGDEVVIEYRTEPTCAFWYITEKVGG